MVEKATFGLVQDTQKLKVALALILPTAAAFAIKAFLLSRPVSEIDLMNRLMLPGYGLFWCSLLVMNIASLEPHQRKRLVVGPDGVAYVDGDSTEWQVDWDALQSVAVRRTGAWWYTDAQDLVFTTKSGEEVSIPTFRFGTGAIPNRTKLLRRLESAGFKASFEVVSPDRYPVKPLGGS